MGGHILCKVINKVIQIFNHKLISGILLNNYEKGGDFKMVSWTPNCGPLLLNEVKFILIIIFIYN